MDSFIFFFFLNIDNSIKYSYAHRIFTPLFFFQTHIVDAMNPRGPYRPSAITIGFSHLVFSHNVRRITGRFPATPEDDRSASSRKIRRKKAIGKAATAGFRFEEGRVRDGYSRNPELFLRVDTRCATKGLIF